jgi:hypothetical protein
MVGKKKEKISGTWMVKKRGGRGYTLEIEGKGGGKWEKKVF